MQKVSRISVMILALLFLTTATAMAMPPNVSQWVPIGSGARALGMGNAFTAIADDATAAWWNPGGLAQLERPEISVVLDHRTVDASLLQNGVDFSGSESATTLNFASVVVPFGGSSQGARKTVAVSYGSFINQTVNMTAANGAYLKTTGGINSGSVDFAMELSPKLMVGAGYNKLFSTGSTDEYVGGTLDHKPTDVEGAYPSLGVLWKAKQFSVGATYRSSFQLTIKENGTSGTIRYPYSGAVGAAYSPTEQFTASFDIQYMNMSSMNGKLTETMEDILQKRIGLEYLVMTKGGTIIPLRAGYYLANRGQVEQGGGTVNIKGMTVGTGIVFKDFQIDAAYSKETQDGYVQDPTVKIGETTIDRILISVIYRF